MPERRDPLQLLKKRGDLIEKHFADKIQERLPSYASIWAEYVGNDGTAHALPMPGVSGEVSQSRDDYSQRAYTLLEGLVLCWDIEVRIAKIEVNKSPEDYLENLNLWTAFYSHLGRIYDMAKDIADDLDRGAGEQRDGAGHSREPTGLRLAMDGDDCCIVPTIARRALTWAQPR